MNKLIALMVAMIFVIGVTGSGCFVRTHGHHGGSLLGAAILTAAIVGTAMVLAEHDAHHHHKHCGCERRHHNGHWVYYYGNHWEYYDSHDGHWYYFED
jgi:hypothetical protein